MTRVILSPTFLSQFDPRVERPGDTACYRACRAMAATVGVVIPEGTQSRIQVASGVTSNGRVIIDKAGAEAAWSYINERIAVGHPVVMGVNYKPGSPNRDSITDHFVLLVGYEMVATHDGTKEGMAAWGEYKQWLAFDPAYTADRMRHMTRWMGEGDGLVRVWPDDGRVHEMSMVVPHMGVTG
jgi:hypothetical protein